MPQPVLGLAATALVILVSLGFISLFEFDAFAGWVSFLLLCLVPVQVVVVVLWNANPPFAARLRQPWKGVLLSLLTAAAAAVIAPAVLLTVGEGVTPPGPIPLHFAIVVVPTMFWLAIMLGGWPFNRLTSNAIAAGLITLAAAYVVTYVGFQLFFNYEFLRGSPAYLASAPQGTYNGVAALVFYTTALAAMFLVLCFDLWPFSASPALMKQPILGIVWTAAALAIGGIVMYVGVRSMGMDPMVFLTRVPVPFIFGSIVVLNMLQNALFSKLRQPLKGMLNAVAAAVGGVALAVVYRAVAPAVTGTLPSGPPGYEQEIWLANALLSVTFPFLIFYAAYLAFWPLATSASSDGP